MKSEAKDFKVGVAFSGGAMRGIAHIGVLAALEEENIEIDIVSGISAGSIVATLYAAGFTAEEMLNIVKKHLGIKAIRPGVPKLGFFSLSYLGNTLKKYIPHNSFEALEKPIWVGATNINTGHLEYFNTGSLDDKIMASCAMPIVFKPVQIEDDLYLDGGVVGNLPARILKNKCDVLVGVNLISTLNDYNNSVNNIVTLASRAFEIAVFQNAVQDVSVCDLVLDPPNLNQIQVYDVFKVDQIFESGYKHTKDKIEAIKKLVF